VSGDGLVRLARGCWLPAGAAEDLLSRCSAVLDTSAEHSAIVELTAARVHGLWLPDLPDELHVATAEPDRLSSAMTRTRRPQIRAHRRKLAAVDVVDVRGVPVASVARTWVDLAAVLNLPDLVAAGDSALRGGASREELAEVVQRSTRLRGVRRARAALPMLDARSRSRAESHLRVAATAPDLPVFQVNEPVYRSTGGWLAEPDLSLAEAKLALEYQGEDHAELKRMRKDITRSTDMRGERWLVIEYGPAEVFGRPWQIAPELRSVVRERAPQLMRRTSRASGQLDRVWSSIADHTTRK
jgi:very-short-patch-repair endonuclease